MDRAGPKHDLQGFTLVELIIVVAIIGILASAAIPGFGRYQMKAKTAEALTNLSAIFVAEHAYSGEFGWFIAAQVSPTSYGGTRPIPFVDAGPTGSNFATLGWEPVGLVYFQYGVTVSGDAYTVEAAADIDGNGTPQLWGYIHPSATGTVATGTLGCSGIWDSISGAAVGRNAIGPCGPAYGRDEF